MNFNYHTFLKTLPVMVKGMSGIFIVTAIIILVMYTINKLTGKKKK